MGQLLTVGFKDVNGLSSRTQFWCNDAITALGAVQALANLSNAQIIGAFLTRELDISTIAANNAVAANIETVNEKAKVRLSGPDAGSAGAPRLGVVVSIPAPVGTIINAPGEAAAALAAFLVNKVSHSSDVVMDTIERIYYSRSK
jgi:hypothetical protein